MSNQFEKTPQEFEGMLKQMGIQDEKMLKNQVSTYEKSYKEAQKTIKKDMIKLSVFSKRLVLTVSTQTVFLTNFRVVSVSV